MTVFRNERHAQSIGFAIKSVLFQFLKQPKIDAKRELDSFHFGIIFRYWWRPWSTYSQFLEILGNGAKSLFFDLAFNVYKIGQKGSKGAPGTARVVLTGVSGSSGVPSGGVRGGNPPRIKIRL